MPFPSEQPGGNITTVTTDVPALYMEGEDLFPEDETDQKRIVTWARKAFETSRDAKRGHQERWDYYYKMYRSYVKKRAKGEWRSRVWMPIAFYVIETVTPKLVAQLPKWTVLPVGAEDAPAAKMMETLIDHASEQSELYIELVKGLKSALLYGTGVWKTSFQEVERYEIRHEPVMQEQYAEIPMIGPGGPEFDLDGNPMMEQVPMGAVETGQTQMTRTPYTAYAGPAAEAVDIENFFVDPAADDIHNARYVIHRVYRDRAHLDDWFQRGIYKRPPDEMWKSFLADHAAVRRQKMIGIDTSSAKDNVDSSLFPLLEVWTDKTMVTIAGDLDYRSGVLLRVERNPYAHGEKPFVRIVDHLVPHEFWGIGELEPLEGLQKIMNELWNSRIDNVKLVLNTMFLAVMDYIVDPTDLQAAPGRVVRVREGVPLNQSVQPLKFGDVTASSYEETNQLQGMIQDVSGVNPLTAGSDTPSASLGRTATGLVTVAEQGNTRFSHKIKIAELTGFKTLARQFAAILQQFAPPEQIIRLLGPDGQLYWQSVTAESIGGRFDFMVNSESSTQTETIRKDQTLSLFQYLAADPYSRPLRIRQDVLEAFGRKNWQEYLLTQEELDAMYAMQSEASGQEEEEAPSE